MTITRIPPHALTADTMPAEGSRIGYTGKAFSGVDFLDHDYISGALDVTEHTRDGFYGSMVMGGADVFVMLDDTGRQTLHGYMA